MPSYTEIKDQLNDQQQLHLLRYWDHLTETQQAGLLEQIQSIDFDAVSLMKKALGDKARSPELGNVVPAPVLSPSPDQVKEARDRGVEQLRANRVGVLLVAGGQGSRLGFDGPKGCFPIGPVSGASLFEIHARKILSKEQQFNCRIPFYIMTSQENDAPTQAFFAENHYFGLSQERVMFFKQGMWPALWEDGKMVMDRSDHLFMSPDGHGGVLSALRNSGRVDDMKARGVETVFYFQVDNPLVEIADPVFVGIHHREQSDMSVKLCEKANPEEKVGIVIKRGDRHAVVEYSELTKEQMYEKTADGELKFRFGSVAIHMFSRRFLETECQAELPLHIAHKKVPYCNEIGQTVKPEDPNAFKFEKFIFDALPDAERTVNLEFAREDEFSPVKNPSGIDSAETAERDIIRKFARWLTACGVDVPKDENGESLHKIEIDPCFADGPEQLRKELAHDFQVTGDIFLK